MKKNKLLLVSWILGVAYLIYIAMYLSGAVSGTNGAEQAGAALATVLLLPHVLIAGVAVLFNILAWLKGTKGFALTAGILYGVSMIMFPLYFMFVVVQMVLCFIAYSGIKKTNKLQEA